MAGRCSCISTPPAASATPRSMYSASPPIPCATNPIPSVFALRTRRTRTGMSSCTNRWKPVCFNSPMHYVTIRQSFPSSFTPNSPISRARSFSARRISQVTLLLNLSNCLASERFLPQESLGKRRRTSSTSRIKISTAHGTSYWCGPLAATRFPSVMSFSASLLRGWTSRVRRELPRGSKSIGPASVVTGL